MMYEDRFNINLKKKYQALDQKGIILRHIISETEIGIDQATVEVISKSPPPIST